jgi:hypothetical protein
MQSESEGQSQSQPQQQQQSQETEEPSPFDAMIKREYELAMDKEIKKALSKINRRKTALMSQESSLTDVQVDALGHDADWYDDLEIAVRSNDPRVGSNKEQIYSYLEGLKFTEMKKLEAVKQMYPVEDQGQTEQPQQQQQQQQQGPFTRSMPLTSGKTLESEPSQEEKEEEKEEEEEKAPSS